MAIEGFVHVIESPSDSDLLNGRTEGRALCEALQLAGIPHWYSLVTTPASFVNSLGTRLDEAIAFHKKPPIIHLSMHGNNDGVALTNGEFISWENLRATLTPISNALNGGLLICMSSCFGTSGCRMAMHEKTDHPFWSLVGNSESTSWGDAAVAYITFYHLFFKGKTIPECVKAMRLASGDDNFLHFSGHKIKADWATTMEKVRREEMINALVRYMPSPSSGNRGLFNQLTENNDPPARSLQAGLFGLGALFTSQQQNIQAAPPQQRQRRRRRRRGNQQAVEQSK